MDLHAPDPAHQGGKGTVCIGTTKKGKPCNAAPESGYRTCPAHRMAENFRQR